MDSSRVDKDELVDDRVEDRVQVRSPHPYFRTALAGSYSLDDRLKQARLFFLEGEYDFLQDQQADLFAS